MKTYWLSFASEEDVFLGACIVDATDEVAAVEESHKQGVNPGGEVMIWEMDPNDPGLVAEFNSHPKNYLLTEEYLTEHPAPVEFIEIAGYIDGPDPELNFKEYAIRPAIRPAVRNVYIEHGHGCTWITISGTPGRLYADLEFGKILPDVFRAAGYVVEVEGDPQPTDDKPF